MIIQVHVVRLSPAPLEKQGAWVQPPYHLNIINSWDGSQINVHIYCCGAICWRENDAMLSNFLLWGRRISIIPTLFCLVTSPCYLLSAHPSSLLQAQYRQTNKINVPWMCLLVGFKWKNANLILIYSFPFRRICSHVERKYLCLSVCSRRIEDTFELLLTSIVFTITILSANCLVTILPVSFLPDGLIRLS